MSPVRFYGRAGNPDSQRALRGHVILSATRVAERGNMRRLVVQATALLLCASLQLAGAKSIAGRSAASSAGGTAINAGVVSGSIQGHVVDTSARALKARCARVLRDWRAGPFRKLAGTCYFPPASPGDAHRASRPAFSFHLRDPRGPTSQGGRVRRCRGGPERENHQMRRAHSPPVHGGAPRDIPRAGDPSHERRSRARLVSAGLRGRPAVLLHP